jgi:hypothetical protein
VRGLGKVNIGNTLGCNHPSESEIVLHWDIVRR